MYNQYNLNPYKQTLMKTIEQIKKELGISNNDIARFFGFKNTNAYNTSSAKKRYENGLCSFYEKIRYCDVRIRRITNNFNPVAYSPEPIGELNNISRYWMCDKCGDYLANMTSRPSRPCLRCGGTFSIPISDKEYHALKKHDNAKHALHIQNVMASASEEVSEPLWHCPHCERAYKQDELQTETRCSDCGTLLYCK